MMIHVLTNHPHLSVSTCLATCCSPVSVNAAAGCSKMTSCPPSRIAANMGAPECQTGGAETPAASLMALHGVATLFMAAACPRHGGGDSAPGGGRARQACCCTAPAAPAAAAAAAVKSAGRSRKRSPATSRSASSRSDAVPDCRAAQKGVRTRGSCSLGLWVSDAASHTASNPTCCSNRSSSSSTSTSRSSRYKSSSDCKQQPSGRLEHKSHGCAQQQPARILVHAHIPHRHPSPPG
jgi:hypothetical protein